MGSQCFTLPNLIKWKIELLIAIPWEAQIEFETNLIEAAVIIRPSGMLDPKDGHEG